MAFMGVVLFSIPLIECLRLLAFYSMIEYSSVCLLYALLSKKTCIVRLHAVCLCIAWAEETKHSPVSHGGSRGKKRRTAAFGEVIFAVQERFFSIEEKRVLRRPETSSIAHTIHAMPHSTLCGMRALGEKAVCVIEKDFWAKFLNFTPSCTPRFTHCMAITCTARFYSGECNGVLVSAMWDAKGMANGRNSFKQRAVCSPHTAHSATRSHVSTTTVSFPYTNHRAAHKEASSHRFEHCQCASEP